MSQGLRIYFKTCSNAPAEFLHELNDSILLRTGLITKRASLEIRNQQITKLRSSIELLRLKRAEFQTRMDDYIGTLQALIERLQSSKDTDISAENYAVSQEDQVLLNSKGTYVRCLSCGSDANFNNIQIVSARESDESLLSPTQLYVLYDGLLKKGIFTCDTCGSGTLMIRPQDK